MNLFGSGRPSPVIWNHRIHSGAKALDRFPGDLLKITPRDLLDPEVVIEHRLVHGRFVCPEDVHILAVLGEQERSAQALLIF